MRGTPPGPPSQPSATFKARLSNDNVPDIDVQSDNSILQEKTSQPCRGPDLMLSSRQGRKRLVLFSRRCVEGVSFRFARDLIQDISHTTTHTTTHYYNAPRTTTTAQVSQRSTCIRHDLAMRTKIPGTRIPARASRRSGTHRRRRHRPPQRKSRA